MHCCSHEHSLDPFYLFSLSNSLSFSRLTFEFPATGGVIPDQSVTAVRLLKYSDGKDYFLMGCEIVFILFILYYIVEETLEIITHKIK